MLRVLCLVLGLIFGLIMYRDRVGLRCFNHGMKCGAVSGDHGKIRYRNFRTRFKKFWRKDFAANK